jgi:hypothetical protein
MDVVTPVKLTNSKQHRIVLELTQPLHEGTLEMPGRWAQLKNSNADIEYEVSYGEVSSESKLGGAADALIRHKPSGVEVEVRGLNMTFPGKTGDPKDGVMGQMYLRHKKSEYVLTCWVLPKK